MTRRMALDSGPLGMITHPKKNPATVEWFRSMLESDCEVIIPEIADYEVRRNLILEDLTESVIRLDALKELLTYLPIDSATMLKAADHWAESRKRGRPTADKHALDGDAILAAQAKLADAVVVTDNVGHLDQFVETRKWSEMAFDKNRPS